MRSYPYPLHHELAYYSPYPLHHELADDRTETRTETRTRTEYRYKAQICLLSDFLPSAVCEGGNKGTGTGRSDCRGIQVVK